MLAPLTMSLPAGASSSGSCVATMRDGAAPGERFERVGQQVREQLTELMRVALDRREIRRQLDLDRHVAARHVALRERNRVADDVRERNALDLQPDRADELEDLEDDGVGHLRFLDDVREDRLRVFASPGAAA